MASGDDNDNIECRCRPLGFLVALPFVVVSLTISLVGALLSLLGALLRCICPCCCCLPMVLDLSLQLIKAPIHVIQLFISKIPC